MDRGHPLIACSSVRSWSKMRRSLCLLSSKKPTNALANIVQGPAILQTSVSRPAPSLFALSGLRSLPYWTQRSATDKTTTVAYSDPYVTAVVNHLEGSCDEIRDEYLAAVGNKTLPPSDYQTQTEHAKLHEGMCSMLTWRCFTVEAIPQLRSKYIHTYRWMGLAFVHAERQSRNRSQEQHQ